MSTTKIAKCATRRSLAKTRVVLTVYVKAQKRVRGVMYKVGLGVPPLAVLIIDDDETFAECCSELLALGSETTQIALTQADGIRSAVDTQPLVILLDVQFHGSDTDGIDAIPALISAAPGTEIVVVSSRYDRADQGRALAAGAFAYMEKGDMKALRSLVHLAGRRDAVSSFVPSRSSELH